jgi:hypothetical protein
MMSADCVTDTADPRGNDRKSRFVIGKVFLKYFARAFSSSCRRRLLFSNWLRPSTWLDRDVHYAV